MHGEPAISIDTLNVDFGRLRVGETGSRTVRISNPGTAPLNVKGIMVLSRMLGVFTHEGSCKTLAPGESCTLTVNFQPAYRGWIQGIMKISSDASNRRISQIKLKGAAY